MIINQTQAQLGFPLYPRFDRPDQTPAPEARQSSVYQWDDGTGRHDPDYFLSSTNSISIQRWLFEPEGAVDADSSMEAKRYSGLFPFQARKTASWSVCVWPLNSECDLGSGLSAECMTNLVLCVLRAFGRPGSQSHCKILTTEQMHRLKECLPSLREGEVPEDITSLFSLLAQECQNRLLSFPIAQIYRRVMEAHFQLPFFLPLPDFSRFVDWVLDDAWVSRGDKAATRNVEGLGAARRVLEVSDCDVHVLLNRLFASLGPLHFRSPTVADTSLGTLTWRTFGERSAAILTGSNTEGAIWLIGFIATYAEGGCGGSRKGVRTGNHFYAVAIGAVLAAHFDRVLETMRGDIHPFLEPTSATLTVRLASLRWDVRARPRGGLSGERGSLIWIWQQGRRFYAVDDGPGDGVGVIHHSLWQFT